MRQLQDLLKGNPIFCDFPEEFVDDLKECAWEMEFQKDQYLFWTGQDAKYMYILRDGKVALQSYTAERGPIVIETMGDSDIVGWSWLFPPHKWHFDAMALEPTRALVLDGRCIEGKCAANHELGYQLMKRFSSVMLDRLNNTRIRMIDIYAKRETSGSNYDFI